MRVGFGFDAHRLVAGRPLILGGCRIPFERGLEGFSDADVVAHAAIDAILGAAALGDCGKYFPAGDPRYAGADSMQLLRKACDLLRDAGYAVANIDCTILAEAPSLAPHLERMRTLLAAALQIDVSQCSAKAKHTEGLGFTGEGAGIAACVIAAIEAAKA